MSELIDALRNCADELGSICYGCAYHDIVHCEKHLKRDAADAIERLIAQVPAWISVEERLPEKYKDVLMWSTYDNDVVIGWKIDGGWGDYRGAGYADKWITHWMPLPKAPEVEG